MTAEMTIVLLNYRRPKNIPIILDSIRRQTIKPVVFVWNNGPDDVNFPGVDRYENSSENIGCMVRWKMARDADTPYVMSLDDDLCFARDDALADIVELLRVMESPDRIIGPAGCCLGENLSYTERRDVYSRHAPASRIESATSTSGYEPVDIVKGRSMALRRDRLDGLGLPEEREDDIFLSAALAGGRRRFHRIPIRLNNAFQELPKLGVGNWRMPGHSHSRDRAAAEYFRPVPGPWRPRRLGTIHQRDAKQLRIRLGGTSVQLNSTAALIWECCDGTRTEAEILAELRGLFSAPEGLLQRDLREALDGLIDAGALEPGHKRVINPLTRASSTLRMHLGLVSETSDAFLNQVKLLLFSLRENGGALSRLPVTLITNSEPLNDREAKFLREHFSPIEFKTSPRLGAIPHTSKLNVFYSIDPSTYDILMFMDCDTVVRQPLDRIADPIVNEGAQFVCRRGGETDRNRFVDFDALVTKFCRQGRTNKILYQGLEEWPMFNSGVFLATSEAVSKIRRFSVEFTYRLFNEWQRNNALEKLPDDIRKQIKFEQSVLESWPIEQGALALASINSGLKVQYLDETYNTWGGETEFHVLHCFKSLYKFQRHLMFSEDAEKWIAEYLASDVPGKVFLASIIREYRRKFHAHDAC